MKIAIFRSDKKRLEQRITEVICEYNFRSAPYDHAVLAQCIIALLEQERVWDHVVED